MRALTEQDYEAQSRAFVRKVVLVAVAIGLALTLSWQYIGGRGAFWLFVAIIGPFGWYVVTRSPEAPPRSIDEQVELLETLWAQEVPASQAAMVREYLNDPEAAVQAIVAHRTAISTEAAQQFMASRVTG